MVKSRLQADGWGAGQAYRAAVPGVPGGRDGQEYRPGQLYRGPLHCMQSSLANEGPTFLTRGLGPTLLRAFPMNAVTFAVYSAVMQRWGGEQREPAETTLDILQSVQPRLSALATDMPNIICVAEQDPLISPFSHARYNRISIHGCG